MDVSALPPPTPRDGPGHTPPGTNPHTKPDINNLQEVISKIVSRQLSGLQQVGKLLDATPGGIPPAASTPHATKESPLSQDDPAHHDPTTLGA